MLKPTQHARTNYRALAPYLETVKANGGHFKFTASGYMPLDIESLGYTHHGAPVYGIMHHTTQNGDLMRDPDMTVAVDAAAGTVDPLTFQNDFMGLYQEVYDDDANRYKPGLRTDLDRFLWQWLKNLEEQGFNPHQQPEPEAASDPESAAAPDPAPEESESNPESASTADETTAPDGQELFPLD